MSATVADPFLREDDQGIPRSLPLLAALVDAERRCCAAAAAWPADFGLVRAFRGGAVPKVPVRIFLERIHLLARSVPVTRGKVDSQVLPRPPPHPHPLRLHFLWPAHRARTLARLDSSAPVSSNSDPAGPMVVAAALSKPSITALCYRLISLSGIGMRRCSPARHAAATVGSPTGHNAIAAQRLLRPRAPNWQGGSGPQRRSLDAHLPPAALLQQQLLHWR